MILVDTNILLYASFPTFSQHTAARNWLDGRLNGDAPVGLPWGSLLGYLRVATNPRVFTAPASMATAWARVLEWLDCDSVWIPEPSDRHATILGHLLGLSGVHSNLVPDAHLAALAIEHGLTLCSSDGDFARFPDLKWLDPLASP